MKSVRVISLVLVLAFGLLPSSPGGTIKRTDDQISSREVSRPGSVAIDSQVPGAPPSCVAVSFKPANNIGIQGGPGSVAVADFNLDGKPDLVTSNVNFAGASVLINSGSGGFNSPVSVGIGGGQIPLAAAARDFNLDGKPDIAMTSIPQGGSQGSLWSTLNNFGTSSCSGTSFTGASGSPFNVGNQAISIAVADFNLDGKPDVATANAISSNISVLLGNGTGGFSAATGSPFSAGSNPNSIAAGDFNLDGKPDLATANTGSGNVSLYLNNCTTLPCAQPIYQSASTISISSSSVSPSALAVGDFNLDGIPDLAVAINASSSNFSNSVFVLLGTGSSTFNNQGPFATGNNPFSIAIADFNLDGKPDVATANHYSPSDAKGSVTVLLGNGAGALSAACTSTVGYLPNAVAVGDFNVDGKPDAVTASANYGAVSVLINSTNICGSNRLKRSRTRLRNRRLPRQR